MKVTLTNVDEKKQEKEVDNQDFPFQSFLYN